MRTKIMPKPNNILPLPKGLTLIRGKNCEIISTKLNESGIVYDTWWICAGKGAYFRNADLEVHPFWEYGTRDLINLIKQERDKIFKECQSKVIQVLGYLNNVRSDRYSYFSYYKIGEDFNWEDIHGKVKFDRGRLVERVIIGFD